MEKWTEIFCGLVPEGAYQTKLINGKFCSQILNLADGYLEPMEMKHYIIITQNYNIDIISDFVPTVEVRKNNDAKNNF